MKRRRPSSSSSSPRRCRRSWHYCMAAIAFAVLLASAQNPVAAAAAAAAVGSRNKHPLVSSVPALSRRRLNVPPTPLHGGGVPSSAARAPRSVPSRPFGISKAAASLPTAVTIESIAREKQRLLQRLRLVQSQRSILSMRGGGSGGSGNSSNSRNRQELGNDNWEDCYRYTTLGFIKLGPQPDDEFSDNTRPVRRKGRPLDIEGLIRRQLAVAANGNGGCCSMVCLPANTSRTGSVGSTTAQATAQAALVGQFLSPSSQANTEQEASSSAPYEVVGCLCDVILILVNSEDQIGTLSSVLPKVLDGIERSSAAATAAPDQKAKKKKKKKIVLSLEKSDSSATDAVEARARAIILDVMKQRETSADELVADIVVVSSIGSDSSASSSTWEDELGDEVHAALDDGAREDKDVPLAAFETLARRVYGAIGGLDLAGGSASPLLKFEQFVLNGETENGAAMPSEYSIDDGADDGIQLDDLFTTPPTLGENEGDSQSSTQFDAPKKDLELNPTAQLIIPKLQSAVKRILSESEEKMSILEGKQDEVFLDTSTNKKMPILEFGSDAQRILQEAANDFDAVVEAETAWDDGGGDGDGKQGLPGDDRRSIEEMRANLLNRVAGESGLRSLFRYQLQALREHYGQRYESILDDLIRKEEEDFSGNNGEEQEVEVRREKRNAILTDAAARATEGFRIAAQNAVPMMCREGSALRDADYDYTSELNGLIQDMMDATLSRQLEEEAWDNAVDRGDDDGDEQGAEGVEARKQRRGPAKWYEKLAARALVLGVNYLQGWLALQGLRRAAAERDQRMPKFPLF